MERGWRDRIRGWRGRVRQWKRVEGLRQGDGGAGERMKG